MNRGHFRPDLPCQGRNLGIEKGARCALTRRGAGSAANRLHRRCRTRRTAQEGYDLTQLHPGANDNVRSLATLFRRSRCRSRRRSCGLRLCTLRLSQCVSRTRQGVTFAINQPLDLYRDLHVTLAIEPLAGSALVGFQLRELRFPEAQNIRLDLEKTCNIPDLEIETIGYRRSLNGALRGRMRCHNGCRRPALLLRVHCLVAV